jgi:hypothetical protein
MAKAKTVADKLLLRPGMTVAAVGQPKDVGALGPKAKSVQQADAVVVFATTSKKVAVPKGMQQGARLWVCYPKAGKLGTDLSRDILWPLMEKQGFEGVRLVSIDDTWSAMAFRPKAS